MTGTSPRSPEPGVRPAGPSRATGAARMATLARMIEVVQVSTATGTREQAVRLAESVVRARLVAGAQITGPVTSVFWHLGEFGTGEEWQLLLKTTAERYPALEAHLVEHHPWTSRRCSPSRSWPARSRTCAGLPRARSRRSRSRRLRAVWAVAPSHG